MATYYTYSTRFYWDGDSVNTGPPNKPRRSTETEPPTLSAGPPQEFALYVKSSDSWEITTTPETFPAPVNFRTIVTTGELLNLIEDVGYLAIFKAAHAQGATADSIALFFLESTIDHAFNNQINISDILTELIHFRDEGFITEPDFNRIIQGVAI